MKTFWLNQHDNSHFHKDQGELIEQLYKKVGKLEVELDWLKKKSGLTL